MYNKQRIRWVDALKLFAIFLVLWGHAIQHLLSSHCADEPVYRIIYSFHMPLFMALSGFFGTRLIGKPFFHVLLTKFRQLLLPMVSATFVYLLFKEFCVLGGVNRDCWFLTIDVKHWFWFLKSAFICSLTYYLVTKFKSYQWVALGVSLIISQLFLQLRFNLMYPSFILGVLIQNKFEWFCRHSVKILFVSGVGFFVMLAFWDSSFWNHVSLLDNARNLIVDNLKEYIYLRYYRMLIGILGTVFFISLFEYLSHHISESHFGNLIIIWGKYTLGVYIFQTFVLELVLAHYVKFDEYNFFVFNFIIAPIISLLVFFVCMAFIELIRKSKWLSFFFLGSEANFKL